MKYKYYSLIHIFDLSVQIVIACSNNIDYTYKGRNYIQMSTSDDPHFRKVMNVQLLLMYFWLLP